MFKKSKAKRLAKSGDESELIALITGAGSGEGASRRRARAAAFFPGDRGAVRGHGPRGSD
jgi:hypothetical protein